jgi:hypothetical protein
MCPTICCNPLRPNRDSRFDRAKIGDRQRDTATKFYQAGLLSTKGLEACSVADDYFSVP